MNELEAGRLRGVNDRIEELDRTEVRDANSGSRWPMRIKRTIKIIKENWGIIWALFAIIAMSLYLNSSAPRWFRLRHFENTLRSQMDPITLQKWAINVIEQHPAWNGTNLPPGAEKVGYWPNVVVHKDYVVLFGGGHGAPELLVGAPSFTWSDESTRMWKPGIYLRDTTVP